MTAFLQLDSEDNVQGICINRKMSWHDKENHPQPNGDVCCVIPIKDVHYMSLPLIFDKQNKKLIKARYEGEEIVPTGQEVDISYAL